MTFEPRDEQTFPSTKWEWRPVKMKPPPAGQDTARAKRGRWWGLATWPRQRKMTLTVQWRGGSQSWWLVTARGRSGTFPGNAAIEDVMATVLNEWNGIEYVRGARGTPLYSAHPLHDLPPVED